jgi:hypothetical protein
MKASEFGQSLLADVRKRNADTQRKAEKRAKRDQWKKLGMNLAMSFAEDVLQSKHQKLMNSEEMMANKLKVDTVYDESNNWSNTLAKAKQYEKGTEEDYFVDNELRSAVRNKLHSIYEPGTYNKTEFDTLENSIVEGYAPQFLESVKKRNEAYEKFISGGDKKAYYDNIKQMYGDGSIGSSITQLLKKVPGVNALTGDVRGDLESINEDIMNRTGKLKEYQDAYKKVKNTTLATHIINNLPPQGVGTPAPVFGTTYSDEITTIMGDQKIRAVDVMITNEDGSKDLRQHILSSYGVSSMGPSQNDALNDFVANAARLTEAEFKVGEMALESMSDEESAAFGKAKDAYLTNRGTKSTNKVKYNREDKQLSDNAARNITMAGRYAKFQGWGTPQQGRAVALQVLKDGLNQENPELDNFVLGKQVPYRTALAINSTRASKAKNAPEATAIGEVLNDSTALYQSYRDMNITQRADLVKKLESENINYFEGKIDSEQFKNTFNAIRVAVDGGNKITPKKFGGSVDNMIDYVVASASSKSTKPKVEQVDERPVESTDKLTFKKPPTLKEAAGVLDRKLLQNERSKLVYQNVRYNAFTKAEKELDRVKNLNRKNLTEKQYNSVLAKAEKEYDKAYQTYKYYYVDTDRLTLLPNF